MALFFQQTSLSTHPVFQCHRRCHRCLRYWSNKHTHTPEYTLGDVLHFNHRFGGSCAFVVLSFLPRRNNSPLSAEAKPTQWIFRRPHKHVHSAIRCNQNAQSVLLCARSSLPHGWTHGPHPDWSHGNGAATWRFGTTCATRLLAAWSSTSASRTTVMGVAATSCKMASSHTHRTSTRLYVLLRAQRKINSYRQ